MKFTQRFLSTTLGLILISTAMADIHQAPWIALQPDDSLIVPLVHAPFVKKRFGTQKPGMYTLPQFRKAIEVKGTPLTQATLQICGLGHFVCTIDGQQVGDHFLDPGWSDYRKSAEYVEFDVTNMLQNKQPKQAHTYSQSHIIDVRLGNGFYNIPRERYAKLLGSYGAPKMKLSLLLQYADGSHEEIVSNEQWMASASPVTYSSIYGGEDYDARLETAYHWTPALPVEPAFEPKLVKQQGTELKIANRRQAIKIWATDHGTWMYDFGENLSGIVALTLKPSLAQVPTGIAITMRPAELLKADGTLNQGSAKPFCFSYTTRGADSVTWQPQFTYYGFRYVEVEGLSADSMQLEALHTTSAVCEQEAGTFHCSNDTLNRIHQLIDRAIRSNLASVPTDCPTREKLGWLEQDYLMLPSMLCRYPIKPLYVRLMQQMAEAQLPDGSMPTIAPYYTEFGWGFDDSPEWGAAFILAPWYLYQHDGDSSLLEQYYEPMQRYLLYLNTRAREEKDSLGQITKPRHIIAYGLGDWYDLGPKGPGYSQLTPNGLTATATYYAEVLAMQQTAELLKKETDAYAYQRLADSIRTAYCAAFDTCRSQTALAMGLSLNLLPAHQTSAAQAALLADLHASHTTSNSKGTQQWQTLQTTGDIGFVYLVRTLAAMNQHALLIQLCTDESIPGYAMQLAKGATALTESWQALDNVSNNHLMLGHIMEWLYQYLGGIQATKHLIAPVTDLPGVNACSCTYSVPQGQIAVQWERNHDGKVALQVTVPEGLTLQVKLKDLTRTVTAGRHYFTR